MFAPRFRCHQTATFLALLSATALVLAEQPQPKIAPLDLTGVARVRLGPDLAALSGLEATLVQGTQVPDVASAIKTKFNITSAGELELTHIPQANSPEKGKPLVPGMYTLVVYSGDKAGPLQVRVRPPAPEWLQKSTLSVPVGQRLEFDVPLSLGTGYRYQVSDGSTWRSLADAVPKLTPGRHAFLVRLTFGNSGDEIAGDPALVNVEAVGSSTLALSPAVLVAVGAILVVCGAMYWFERRRRRWAVEIVDRLTVKLNTMSEELATSLRGIGDTVKSLLLVSDDRLAQVIAALESLSNGIAALSGPAQHSRDSGIEQPRDAQTDALTVASAAASVWTPASTARPDQSHDNIPLSSKPRATNWRVTDFLARSLNRLPEVSREAYSAATTDALEAQWERFFEEDARRWSSEMPIIERRKGSLLVREPGGRFALVFPLAFQVGEVIGEYDFDGTPAPNAVPVVVRPMEVRVLDDGGLELRSRGILRGGGGT